MGDKKSNATNYHELQTPQTNNDPLRTKQHEVRPNTNKETIIQGHVALTVPEDTGKDAKTNGKDIKKTKELVPLVPLMKLFSYASKLDLVLIACGSIGAIATGVVMPLQTIFFGDLMNSFNAPGSGMKDAINKIILKFIWIGLGILGSGFIQVTCWTIAASRQAKRYRYEYISSIMQQEIGWYDLNDPLQLATKVADTTTIIQDGLGRKVGEGLQFAAMAIGGFIIGFIKGWELSLIILAISPILAVAAFVMMKSLAAAVQGGTEAYAAAGAIAEETLGSIRTIHSFNAIEKQTNKFNLALEDTEKAGVKKGTAVGYGVGFLFLVAFCTYALGLYYGAYKVTTDRENHCKGSGCYDGGRVIMVFFAVMTGAMAFGQAGPSLQAVFSAKAAAVDLYKVIERKSLINPIDKTGIAEGRLEGNIRIANVTFHYPSRPEITVCQRYSLQIKAGEKIALVGPSGSGKSTIISLIERFYDPEEGIIELDGIDIRKYNVGWLRQQISLVGQEPMLFSNSIKENIRLGKLGVSDEQIIYAAKLANAYDFIIEFPNGFDTEVGERGVQLSGGQKQRIAIARAIVKDPSILLLDEATSALDTESERIVQESLDRLLAMDKSRTTIIVAHRLSTIQDANRIAVHEKGCIVELGTHKELMDIPKGKYRSLVMKQTDSSRSKNNMRIDKAMIDQKENIEEFATATKAKSFHQDDTEEQEDIMVAEKNEDSTHTQKKVVLLKRIWALSSPDKLNLGFGVIGAIISGAAWPLWGFMITKMTVIFFKESSKSKILHDARLWAMGFVLLGIVYFGGSLLQNINFAIVSERLTRRIRSMAFARMLRQEIGWFDRDENTSGALATRLAIDSATIQSMTGEALNRTLMAFFSLGCALVISFVYSWQMTLVMLAVFPIMGAASFIQMSVVSGESSTKKANEGDVKAGALLSECVGAIRTVSSFALEGHMIDKYHAYIHQSEKTDIKHGVSGGLAFGISQCLIFCTIAFLYWFGGELVTRNKITFEDMFMVVMSIMLSSMGVGIAAQNMADANKAKEAAKNVFKIIDRQTAIDSLAIIGETPACVQGHLLFKNLVFAYPSRPSAMVYTNYTLEINAGETVALVGVSGAGKSTAIALLERFYHPIEGTIYLDGKDIQQYNIRWLRDHISLVSQEPVLFTGTIAENISFGKENATEKDIIEAAKMANADDFISQFPDGYNTNVGERGVQVSGGQKQRIALARAIIRDPVVLLLDEATSALDTESERIVQQSLDRLLQLKKRTTIIVAHRLSTIRDADKIAVTSNGKIMEQGKHAELINIDNGIYKNLVARQTQAQDN